MGEFKDKTIWVTGAGSGIGADTAMQFYQAGAQVIGFDLAFATSMPFQAITLDISNFDAVQQIGTDYLQQSGLDILINAAGILRFGATETMRSEDWEQTFSVNAKAAFNLFHLLIPHFKQQRSGNIVSIISNAAHVPRVNMSIYCASKAAMRSLCLSVGLELAPFQVRCNLVSPGSTNTPMLESILTKDIGYQQIINGIPHQFKLGIPLNKIAQPEDITHTILFLASEKAGHITLQDIVVDGGATLGH